MYPWIDRELEKLYQRWHPRWRLFDPTPAFWNLLSTEHDRDLQRATYALGQHLGLLNIPQAEYTLSLMMGFGEAGVIQGSGSRTSTIHIPLAYVGVPYAIGAILAHEITHQHLDEYRLVYPKVAENERFTDLATLANGLGKLVLNGLSAQAQPFLVEDTEFGYISSAEKIYAYRKVCQQYGVVPAQMKANLVADVLPLLEG